MLIFQALIKRSDAGGISEPCRNETKSMREVYPVQSLRS